MHLRTIVLIAGITLFPSAAFAMRSETWDFRSGQVPNNWDVANLQKVTPEADGLHIFSALEGRITTAPKVDFPIDAISVTFTSPRPLDAMVVWHPRGASEGTLVQLPIRISVGTETQNINLSDFPDWDKGTDRLGFIFPAHTDAYLQSMELLHWNATESAIEMWKSFWTFDQLLPYSINFLWGPVLTVNPFGTQSLFLTLPPPRGIYMNKILLPILGLIALLIVAAWVTLPGLRGKRKIGAAWPVGMLFLIVATAWVLFDIRMGVEFIHYAKTDYAGYVSQPVGDREFRNLLNFYDAVEVSMAELKSEPIFGLLAPQGAGLDSRLRYLAYPSLPVQHPTPEQKIHTWFVFARPDVTVTDAGQLIEGDTVISEAGEILKRFNDSSFLYRSR